MVFDHPKSAITSIPATSDHYIPNSRIIQKSKQIVGQIMLFSMQDQQEAMRLIVSRQVGPTKASQQSRTCYDPTLVYFGPLQSKF
jgi:hypothetical protein